MMKIISGDLDMQRNEAIPGGPVSRNLLDIENLRVTYPTRTGVTEVVRGVSFSLGRERLAIVGESGSGKSQTGRAIMGLTVEHGVIDAKRLEFDGLDLLKASKAE